eukprot:NODE_13_length_54415_cov_0.522424.p47 type:complete len:122 gc:universal NODE_13_length_54415_cov_0.522424:27501-27136(-)
MLKIVPIGLHIPFPAISGAHPWIGSYKPLHGGTPHTEADGRHPIEPQSTDISSLRISPNKFVVRTTPSIFDVFLIKCMAAASTRQYSISTLVKLLLMQSVATCLKNFDDAKTLALSTIMIF